MIQKRVTSADRKRSGSADKDGMLEGALIYGYLKKWEEMENGKHGGLKPMDSASPIMNPAIAPSY